MQCYACSGAGRTTCPACGGKGSYWKVVGRQNVWEPCYQCGGQRNARCPTCGGTGVLPDPVPPPDPRRPPQSDPNAKPPPDPALLQLEGRWKALGAKYDFVKEGDGYHVTAYNFLGMKIGEGEAEPSGRVLTLTVRNPLTGAMAVDLQLNGDRLTGTTRGLLTVPVTLKRA